ncbi:MAG: LysR substrate-binding domain-containing protein [Rhodobacteraceae bacterium]|nr:LysR substrate-binding domain-containing protein [Paracoccaceae bacterium]
MNLDWRMIKALNHLGVFEMAVDAGSFTGAAKRLGTTQPSVSRHIAALESLLEVQLFDRLKHRVELTDAGLELFEAVKLGLDHVRQAVNRVASRPASNTVSIGCTYGFAHMWLMPRFSAMQKMMPEYELRMVTADSCTVFDLNEVDFALRFGSGNWPELKAVKLFGEQLFPVCAPEFANQHFGSVDNVVPAMLAQMPLIHEREEPQSWLSWPQWLGWHGVDYTPRDDTYYFDNYAMTLQAAMDGEGVALAWQQLAEQPLKSGALTELTGLRVSTESGYHLVHHRNHPLAAKIVPWFQARAAEQG